jgi:hypothetical protein
VEEKTQVSQANHQSTCKQRLLGLHVRSQFWPIMS